MRPVGGIQHIRLYVALYLGCHQCRGQCTLLVPVISFWWVWIACSSNLSCDLLEGIPQVSTRSQFLSSYIFSLLYTIVLGFLMPLVGRWFSPQFNPRQSPNPKTAEDIAGKGMGVKNLKVVCLLLKWSAHWCRGYLFSGACTAAGATELLSMTLDLMHYCSTNNR